MKKKSIITLVLSILIAIVMVLVVVFITTLYSRTFDSNFQYKEENYKVGNLEEVVIASYNVKSGYNTKDNLNKIRDQLNSYNVDLVGLQEIDSDTAPRSKKIKCISTLARDGFEEHYFEDTQSFFLGDNYGIMSMSKYKMVEKSRQFLPMPNRWFLIIGEPRVCIRTVVNIKGTDIALYNTHLSFENNIKLKDKKDMRQAQIECIYDLMEKDPCQYKVLVGDFNILNFDELSIFEKDGKYKLVNNKDTNFESYRGDDVTFKCLDNIIYSSNMQLEMAKMEDNDLSDHNMLVAKFKL